MPARMARAKVVMTSFSGLTSPVERQQCVQLDHLNEPITPARTFSRRFVTGRRPFCFIDCHVVARANAGDDVGDDILDFRLQEARTSVLKLIVEVDTQGFGTGRPVAQDLRIQEMHKSLPYEFAVRGEPSGPDPDQGVPSS